MLLYSSVTQDSAPAISGSSLGMLTDTSPLSNHQTRICILSGRLGGLCWRPTDQITFYLAWGDWAHKTVSSLWRSRNFCLSLSAQW